MRRNISSETSAAARAQINRLLAQERNRTRQRAATTIQRIFRGGAARTALRTGTMRRNVRKARTSALLGLKAIGLPVNMQREVMKRAVSRVPDVVNRKHIPKTVLAQNMKNWLRLAHTNAFNLTENQYNAYLNRLHNYQHSQNRNNKIKAILARYELLQPQGPTAAVTRSPTVIRWRGRLETNFKRKYAPRHTGRLSSRELYSFLKTMPTIYLHRTLQGVPNYA